MGTFGVVVAAADGVGVSEQVAEISGWRMQKLNRQKEGLLGCSLGPISEALALSFAFDSLDSGQATTANRNTVTKETESVKYSLLT